MLSIRLTFIYLFEQNILIKRRQSNIHTAVLGTVIVKPPIIEGLLAGGRVRPEEGLKKRNRIPDFECIDSVSYQRNRIF